MAVYNLSPIFQIQAVANAAAALTFTPAGGGTTVAVGYQFRTDQMRCANITSAPVTLKVWRVKSGATNVDANIVVPITVTVPVASNTFPHLDITALWGAVLSAGDAIWAVAGSANALNIWADGIVGQL